jgi:hypothetical protein
VPKVTFSANASPNSDEAIENVDRSGVVPNTNVCGAGKAQQVTPGPETGGADWVTIVMVSE